MGINFDIKDVHTSIRWFLVCTVLLALFWYTTIITISDYLMNHPRKEYPILVALCIAIIYHLAAVIQSTIVTLNDGETYIKNELVVNLHSLIISLASLCLGFMISYVIGLDKVVNYILLVVLINSILNYLSLK